MRYVLLFTVCLGVACHEQTSTKQNEPCRAGGSGCPCRVNQSCDGGLICDAGYCVPIGCSRGIEGCACHADGICDALAGTPMSCDGNLCTATASSPSTGPGASCSDESPCRAQAGEQMECVSGRCELPGCPSGRLGCPCGPYGACEPIFEQPVRCSLDRCVLGGCSPGSLGCACDTDSACNDALVCADDACRPPPLATLALDNPQARACDVLLTGDAVAHARVVFGPGVKGHQLRRAPKLALSFVSRSDAAMTEPVARIEATQTIEGDASLQLATSTCYDRLGALLAHPGVSLQ